MFLCLYARTMPRPTHTPSASRTKPFAYRPPDPKRATLLFDLDHTLVEVQSQARRGCVTMPTAATGYKFSRFTTPAPTFDRFPAHGLYSTIPDLQDATRAQSIVHYRPHIVPFLHFCFEHFNVGFWSTAAAVNVHHIALNLLRLVDRQPADLMCAWARRNIRGSSNPVPEVVKFIDALTVKRWLELDAEISTLNTALRERRREKDDLNKHLLAFMQSNQTPHFEMSKGNLSVAVSKHKQPLTRSSSQRRYRRSRVLARRQRGRC